ncbi:MAG: hypothetical protein E6Q25_07175 [Acinetobacter sp.]|jgi:hypothetical protein|nr:MAG: hypothetical protein E6Q25_07175 [Acinetobacter sp.]
MSAAEGIKDLLDAHEMVLELVQLEEGVMALRAAGSEQEPLVRIEFNDEVRKILGEHTGVVAQHMIQAAIYGVMEQQMNRWHAHVVDDKPQFYS